MMLLKKGGKVKLRSGDELTEQVDRTSDTANAARCALSVLSVTALLTHAFRPALTHSLRSRTL